MTQKTAIITGASRGLGRDMALNLAKDGVNIIFSYHSNDKKAKEVILEIESVGKKRLLFLLMRITIKADKNLWPKQQII